MVDELIEADELSGVDMVLINAELAAVDSVEEVDAVVRPKVDWLTFPGVTIVGVAVSELLEGPRLEMEAGADVVPLVDDVALQVAAVGKFVIPTGLQMLSAGSFVSICSMP